MRFVTYDAGGGPQAGTLSDDGGIPPLAPGAAGALLRGSGLPSAAPAEGAPLALDDVRLLPPVPDPSKIVCMGLNYRDHAAEAGLDPPQTPTFFAKFANALAPAGSDVELPGYSSKVDYEAEVVFVIGRRCKDVPESDALGFI